MNMRSKYKTNQRKILLAYLKSMVGSHVTASDICEYFKKNDMPIGKSTIYRQLESLVGDGIISKYVIDGSHSAYFEYLETDGHNNIKAHFHCKCEKCGKIIHLNCKEYDTLQEHLFDEHRFKPDLMKTVIYGLCEQCI
ncbi:MAG: transcriptional repressor [Firmicutes bacterium]|nr:transcriptional repressor [Bacillota bacterium]